MSLRLTLFCALITLALPAHAAKKKPLADCVAALKAFAMGEPQEKTSPASAPFKVTYGNPTSPAVLLLHGLFNDHQTFEPVIADLAKHYYVVAYDVRGFGASPARGPNYSTAALAKDAVGILDTLGIKKAHWVGHSLGGRTAARAAELYPDRVESLVIEDIDLSVRSKLDRAVVEANWGRIAKEAPRVTRTVEEMRQNLKRELGDVGTLLFAFHERGPDGTCSLPFEPYCEYLWEAESNSENLIPSVTKSKAPLLLLRGLDSQGTTPDGIAALRRARPDSQVIDFSTGHYVHEEDPLRFSSTVISFLQSIEKKK